MDFWYDEFGFKVEEEGGCKRANNNKYSYFLNLFLDGPEQSSNKLLSEKFVEDFEHRFDGFVNIEGV